jgi:hypothetical protein
MARSQYNHIIVYKYANFCNLIIDNLKPNPISAWLHLAGIFHTGTNDLLERMKRKLFCIYAFTPDIKLIKNYDDYS